VSASELEWPSVSELESPSVSEWALGWEWALVLQSASEWVLVLGSPLVWE
jgi:hypothetical protein